MVSRCFVCLFVLIYLNTPCIAQSDMETPKVPLFDLRAETPERAVLSAIHASKEKAVIVMTRGASKELNGQVYGDLTALSRNDYKRVVLVFAQPFEEDPSPLICIYANGYPYAMLKHAKADAQTSLDLYKLVKEAYDISVNSK